MIISVVNTKGGVGKSTVSINLATGLAKSGLDVLLIDTDVEGTSVAWSDRREEPTDKLTVVSLPKPQALKNEIQGFVDRFDLIVIDGAPHLAEMLTISVAVSSLVIVPISPSPNDIWKLEPMIDRIKDIQGYRNGIQVYFLVNNFMKRTRLSREIVDALTSYGLPILETRLSTRMDYRDSLGQGTSAVDFSNKKARLEVSSLIGEVREILNI